MAAAVAAVEIAVACHTRQTPEVLVLAVGTVAPAEGLEGEQIVAGVHIGGHVKLGGGLAVFGIAHKLTVHPKVHVGGDTAEVGYHLAAFPSVGHLYHLAVAAHMVVFYRHLGRIVLEVSAPGETDVHINRVAETVQLPDARHRHHAPRCVVVRLLVEVGGPLIGIFHPVEFPVTLKRQITVAGRTLVFLGFFLVFISEERGVHGETVHLVHLHVMPLLIGRSSRLYGCCGLVLGCGLVLCGGLHAGQGEQDRGDE